MATVTLPNGLAPNVLNWSGAKTGTFRLGAKGGRMAAAWQDAWNGLSRTEWTRADVLADQVSRAHDIKPTTIKELFSRMRAQGVLEQKMIPVPTTYARGKGYTANRPRVHYRIKQEAPDTTALSFSEPVS